MRRPYLTTRAVPSFFLAVALAACGATETTDDRTADPGSTGDVDCLDAGARDIVQRFGRALQQVSLLAPDSILDASLRQHYGELVTPALLEQWINDPALAPGRLTSSPWPDRIEVSAAEEEGGVCVVRGTIVYATSTDTAGGEALHERVTLRLENDDGWRISGFAREEGGSDAAAVRDRGASGADAISSSVDGDAAPSPQEAAEVIRQYYAAIAAGDFARAYRLWSNNGGASGQTLQEFARGFAGTASVEADIGAPGDVEGAAGSVYVKVPVVVRAVTTDGERQRFEGTYTLRRSNVDGATEEQRAWRIYDADISPAADSAAPDA